MSTHTNINMSTAASNFAADLSSEPISFPNTDTSMSSCSFPLEVVVEFRGCCLFWCRAKPHFRACLAGWVQIRCVRGG